MFFTQNPIGSSANEDLQDNAISFDYAMNSPAALWQDRFGKQHKTVQQALKDVGFKPAGFDFVSGGTLGIGDRDKCVFYPTDGYWYSWNGKLPYVVPANSSPTPGGKKGWGVVTRDERVIAREALRRTYLEVGLNLVEGSFEEGAVITSTTDVVLHESGGKVYSWVGVIPKVVPGGANPVDDTNWNQLSDLTLREKLEASGGAELVGTNEGGTVQGVLTTLSNKTGAVVTPEMFGAVSTPAETATTLNAAAEHCRTTGAKLIAGTNTYQFSGAVSLRSVKCDFSSAVITVETGSILYIGGSAGVTINPEQIFGIIKQPRAFSFVPDDYTEITVKCMGAKGQTIRISQVDRMEFFQSTNPATFPNDASQAYSKFFIDFVVSLGVNTDPLYNEGPSVDGPGSANQWFNENQLYIGRVVSFYMRGSYRHNNNRIYGGCFETANAYLNIQIGNKNRFVDLRCEGDVGIVFGTKTLGNVVDVNWFSSEAQIYQQPTGDKVIDNGSLNIIKDSRISPTNSDCVFLVTNNDVVHNGQPSNYNFRLATKRAIRGNPRTTPRIIGESEFIDTGKGDYFFAKVESLTGFSSAYIIRIYLYDKNKTLITGDLANLETSVFTTIFPDRAEGRVNDRQLHHRFGILNPAVRYVRLQLLNTGSVSEDNAIIVQVNRVTRSQGRDRRAVLPDSKSGFMSFVTSVPTQFVGQVGTLIGGSTNDYRCVFSVTTTLEVAAAAGATVLVLATYAATGLGSVAINDLIGIDTDDGSTHWTTVSAIGGGELTLTVPLPSSAGLGSVVYLSRLGLR